MTKINHESPVIRETASLYKNRPIVVELHSGYIAFRVKGLKTLRASVSYEGAFQRALQGEANLAAAEKRAGKPVKVSRGLLKTSSKGI